MLVYDGTGLLQTYTNGNTNSVSNIYGPFLPETGMFKMTKKKGMICVEEIA
jgi:hypothetical protein